VHAANSITLPTLDFQCFTIAAAEPAIGLAIVLAIHCNRGSTCIGAVC
jgi:NADH:ubiquinone oxidoreductase subunit K